MFLHMHVFMQTPVCRFDGREHLSACFYTCMCSCRHLSAGLMEEPVCMFLHMHVSMQTPVCRFGASEHMHIQRCAETLESASA